jgi:hypothetical protein
LANLEIDEVTINASLSMDTSPVIEKIALLNPGVNPEKYEHPFLIKYLNPGGEVLP